MKLISFIHPSGPRPGVALSEKIYLDLLAADPELPASWNLLFAHLDRVAELFAQWHEPGGVIDGVPLISSNKYPLLPPVTAPSKIIAVGLNYRDHAEEQKRRAPAQPILFGKASTCLQAHEGPIVLDPDLTRVDAEAELAVVIGRAGKRISREDAASHIAGYMCFNDVTNREAQHSDKQFFRGKSIDTGGPCGPWLVTPDELPPLAHGLGNRGPPERRGRPEEQHGPAHLSGGRVDTLRQPAHDPAARRHHRHRHAGRRGGLPRPAPLPAAGRRLHGDDRRRGHSRQSGRVGLTPPP